ncbi:MAG TPA: AAA family ATPase [Dehalococcoidia bacterium]|nr:AAA family ATPase [Dehalococcoidia bacterium]
MTWTLVGQEQAVAALAGAAGSGRAAHAYLFAGPAHVGKTLAAIQFAQTLNCTGAEPPCGRCRQCERIAAGAHPDVDLVGIGGMCDESEHRHSADDSRSIRVCQVRRVQHLITRAPFEGRCRVVIFEPADALEPIAANALLKTLEEPPDNVVLILVTDREEMLLPTIRSRARRVAFGGLTQMAIERALRTRWDAEPSLAARLARLAGGRLGWALLALRDERMVDLREEALDRAQALASAPMAERFAFAAELGGRYTKDRAGVQAALETWQAFWRDILLIAAGREQQAAHRERLDRLRALAAQCDVAGAARALRAIADARQQLVENGSPILVLQVMMLAVPELRANAVSERLTRTGGAAMTNEQGRGPGDNS